MYIIRRVHRTTNSLIGGLFRPAPAGPGIGIKPQTAALFAVILAVALAVSGPGTLAPGAAAAQAPPLEGEFADNFNPLDPPVPAPPPAFTDRAGNSVRLSDFQGKVVLLNFWATWCAPCVREMPSLERLQAKIGAEGLAVVAVSIDRGGFKVIKPFAERLRLTNLGLYHDNKAALFKAFGVTGLPTTFVIDRKGRVVGAYPGAAEWDSPEAVKLLRHYLRPSLSQASAAEQGG